MDILKKILGSHKESAKGGLFVFLKTCKDDIVTSFLVKNLGLTYPEEETLGVLIPLLKHPDTRVIANCVEGISAVSSPKTTVLIALCVNIR